MTKFVALIRAINVGGHSVITMAELKKRFEKFGYENVTTYIQTGNVLFSSGLDAQALARRLSDALSTLVLVYTKNDLKKALSAAPFTAKDLKTRRCHLMFLAEKPKGENQKALKVLEDKTYRFDVKDRVCYYSYPVEVIGKRKTFNLEKILGVQSTSRTFNVVQKLDQLL